MEGEEERGSRREENEPKKGGGQGQKELKVFCKEEEKGSKLTHFLT